MKVNCNISRIGGRRSIKGQNKEISAFVDLIATQGGSMTDKNFTVMIAGLAKPGMEEYVKKYLTELMKHSRQDNGCLIYNIHQSTKKSTEFMVYMLWESKEAFEHHNKKPEMQEFKKRLSKEMFEQQSPKTYWHLLD